jgi:hypothetical protein
MDFGDLGTEERLLKMDAEIREWRATEPKSHKKCNSTNISELVMDYKKANREIALHNLNCEFRFGILVASIPPDKVIEDLESVDPRA